MMNFNFRMYYHFLIKIFICLFLGLALNSCATFYNVYPATHAKYQKPNNPESNFDISGRFYFKNTNTGKSRYGNFTWVKNESMEELDLVTPLGQTVAKITIESGNVVLNTRDKTYVNHDLDHILEEHFGFVLPLSYMHYWILGIELPNYPKSATFEDGFMQVGWRVQYLEWVDRNHPKIIQFTRGDVMIKMLLEW